MRYINLHFTYLYRVNGYKKKVMCRPVKERQETDRQTGGETDRQTGRRQWRQNGGGSM